MLPRSPRASFLSTSPLTSFPLRFNSSNWFCLRVMPFSTYTYTMPFRAGSSQHSLVPGSRIEERIYIGQCYTLIKKKLLWENIWKVYKQSNRNSKWSFIPVRVLYHIQSIMMIFAPLSFQIAYSFSPILKVFTSSSLPLFGRFSFSFSVRFKITPSEFKVNKYYNYNKTDSSITFKLLLYSFGKKSWART